MKSIVVLFAPNSFLCCGCKINFYAPGGGDRGRHFTAEEVVKWGLPWDQKLADCPNAGKTFQLPVCVQLMDEETA
jgi:hypothetical protein